MTNPNDPAHPDVHICGDGQRQEFSGLTKREYFAGLAMQGLMHPSNIKVSNGNGGATYLAGVALDMADALIAELNKPSAEEGA